MNTTILRGAALVLAGGLIICAPAVNGDSPSDLLRDLRSTDAASRAKAAAELAKPKAADNDTAVRALTKALKDKDAHVRTAVAHALFARLHNGKPIESKVRAAAFAALLQAVHDETPKVRFWAVKALGQRGAASLVPAVAKMLQDKDPAVRAQAAIALGNIGSVARAAAPDLVRALGDKDKEVRSWAANGLAIIGAADKMTLHALSRVLKEDQSADVRWWAAYSLGYLRSKARDAVPALIQALKDSAPKVRGQAIVALGWIGPTAEAAVAPLMELLKNENPSVRAEAARALGKIGGKAREAVPTLTTLLKSDKDERVREGAATALAALKGQR